MEEQDLSDSAIEEALAAASNTGSILPPPAKTSFNDAPSHNNNEAAPSKISVKDEKSHQEYLNLLEKSKHKNFEEFVKMDILYVSGRDPLGRPIVVFVASRLPAKRLNMDDFLLFVIHVLDAIVKEEYVLVYVGTDVTSDNRPTVAWLKKAYRLFSRNYKKHIQKLYIIHPTPFTRLVLKVFKLFISEKFWRKLIQVEDVSSMFTYISREQLRLPEACFNGPPRKGQKFVIFGTTLLKASLNCPHDSQVCAPIYNVICWLAENGLEVEGLFRVSGSDSTIKSLRLAMEEDNEVPYMKQEVHSVCGVLKTFIRELRVAVLPGHLFEPMTKALKIEKDEHYANETAKHLLELPSEHRAFLSHLMALLLLVAQHEALNKMGYSNLAVVLAPYLLGNNARDPRNALSDTATQSSIIHRLLKCWHLLCQCDPSLLVVLPSQTPVSLPSHFEKRADVIGNPTDVVRNTDISDPQHFQHVSSGHVSAPSAFKHNLHM